MDFKQLENTHDLRIGDWGPYTKKHIGISHIASHEQGLRFDLCAAPGFYRRKTLLPNVRRECGYHPWECSGDLSYFSHRHELEWKDQVYCDISFSPVKENLRLMRCEMVNNTPSSQNLVLHLFASLQPPTHTCYKTQLSAGTVWVDALDFSSIRFASPSPQDNLVWDGMRPGQVRKNGFVDGVGIGGRFGGEAGDTVEYTFTLEKAIRGAGILLRYCLADGKGCKLQVSGAVDRELSLYGREGMCEDFIDCGSLEAGTHKLRISCCAACRVELDGFAVGNLSNLECCRFVPVIEDAVPQMRHDATNRTLFLKYKGVEQTYGLWWSEGSCVLRQYHMKEIDPFFYERIHNHVNLEFHGEGEGHYAEIFIRPVVLQPQSKRVVYALVGQGDGDTIAALLKEYAGRSAAFETLWTAASEQAICPAGNRDGEAYCHGQQLMAATTLSNCVFPAYAKGRHIRHHSPGRWWDSLYTWDSGFIGLGLLELDYDRAIDNLNAYVTEPGDMETAFVFHGSMVPVQHYLFLEMWNRGCDRQMLEFFYPRLKQYYDFYVGRLGSSNTLQFSGLLATWSYFYNSGGWDDYPPQQYYWANQGKFDSVPAPAVNTAHAIRIAKILSAAASELGLDGDIAEYSSHIDSFADALEKYSWDEENGYYGYVLSDENGVPTGLLQHESGQNYNMGLDGLSPLIADVCPSERREGMYNKLTSPEKLWTPIGLSTVDQSAAYYQHDGYWNGAVWMPHQWFFWKTALDHGKGDFAWQVARTALELWAAETGNSYNCFEHFIIASGRGAGWHQFGGLSTPVLCWYTAYFKPGRINGGLNCWMQQSEFTEDCTGCRVKIKLLGNVDNTDGCRLLVTLVEGTYQATWNGEPATCVMRTAGCCDITLPAAGEGELIVSALDQ